MCCCKNLKTYILYFIFAVLSCSSAIRWTNRLMTRYLPYWIPNRFNISVYKRLNIQSICIYMYVYEGSLFSCYCTCSIYIINVYFPWLNLSIKKYIDRSNLKTNYEWHDILVTVGHIFASLFRFFFNKDTTIWFSFKFLGIERLFFIYYIQQC